MYKEFHPTAFKTWHVIERAIFFATAICPVFITQKWLGNTYKHDNICSNYDNVAQAVSYEAHNTCNHLTKG